MVKRPNVVLICVDQWRGDCLGIDRHPVVRTPYLDQLAGGGVHFTKAYAAAPSCIAARASLFSGLTPRSHGRVGYRDGVPWNYETTVAGEFTRHGYQTQAVGKMHVYPERSQIGFQNVILHDGYLHFARDQRRNVDMYDDYLPWLRRELGRDADYFDHGLNCNAIPARPWDKEEYLHPTNWVTSQSIDFLNRRDPRKPFFLFMSYHRPHPPYDPPAWAFEQYLDAEMPPPPHGDWTGLLTTGLFQKYVDSTRPDSAMLEIDPGDLRRARAGYYGHMTHIDHQINRFMETLGEYRLADNTYVCFVSDHGELMGDHGLFRKTLPYEGSARVPFIIKGPQGGCVPQRRGGISCDKAVELMDVMPTLLDCAGLPVPASVEGRSVLPLVEGGAVEWRPYLHGEHETFGQSIHWLTDGKEKYVWMSGDGTEQVFDLVEDPQETKDLMRGEEGLARSKKWRKALIAELRGREEGYVKQGRLVPGRPATSCLSHIL